MADITYVTIPDLTAAQDSEVTDSALIEMAVVDANGTDGYSSKKVTREQLLSDLNSDLSTSASIDGTGLITFKNDDNQTTFTLQLPVYNGGVG